MKGREWIRTEYYFAQNSFPHSRFHLTFHRAMAEDGSNQFRYMRFLNRCAEGRCLWYPTTVDMTGDVGLVREGYLNKVTTQFG